MSLREISERTIRPIRPWSRYRDGEQVPQRSQLFEYELGAHIQLHRARCDAHRPIRPASALTLTPPGVIIPAMDSIAAYNLRRWEALDRAGAVWTRPWLDLDPAEARRRVDPHGRFGDL